MSKYKIFDSIADQLTESNQNATETLDNFIKYAINLVNSVEELREELRDKNFIFQMNIIDMEFSFWLKVNNGKAVYEKGVSKEATIKADITKAQVIKMMRGELKAIDDYMKGKIRAFGSLGHGLFFIKMFRLIIKYLTETSKKRER